MDIIWSIWYWQHKIQTEVYSTLPPPPPPPRYYWSVQYWKHKTKTTNMRENVDSDRLADLLNGWLFDWLSDKNLKQEWLLVF